MISDDVIHRLLVLSAMLAVIFLAANIDNVFSDGAMHTIEEASHQFLSAGTSWALCGGVALYMLSIGVI